MCASKLPGTLRELVKGAVVKKLKMQKVYDKYIYIHNINIIFLSL